MNTKKNEEDRRTEQGNHRQLGVRQSRQDVGVRACYAVCHFLNNGRVQRLKDALRAICLCRQNLHTTTLRTHSPAHGSNTSPRVGCWSGATGFSASSTASITAFGIRPTIRTYRLSTMRRTWLPESPRARRPCKSTMVCLRSRGRSCWAWSPGWWSRRASS